MDSCFDARLPRTDLYAMLVLLVFAALVWVPAVWTPFWGDDYVFLHAARVANLADQPWLETFWPSQPLQFWRPLSQEAWWRLVDHVLGADTKSAHVAMLLLHVLASFGVGLLGFAVARAAGWRGRLAVGGLAGSLYCVMAVSLLSVHWVAAANSPILVMFTALALSSWLWASVADGAPRALLLAAVPCLFAAALLSKESAILTPVLMVLLGLFTGMRLRTGELFALAVCVVIGIAWLLLREMITAPSAPQYAYAFGGNLPRNAMSLTAWLLNVPREALRMIATGELGKGAFFALLAALPVMLAWWFALKGGESRLSARQWWLLAAFPVIAYAPYFPLAWNSYAYYAAVAAILPAVALARLLQGRGAAAVLAAVLMSVSAWLSVAGTRWLDHPGLIGRARWGEASMQDLSAQRLHAPLWVRVVDEQRFYAVGVSGLAWRLGMPQEQIHVVETCPADRPGTCLEMDSAGRWTRRAMGQ